MFFLIFPLVTLLLYGTMYNLYILFKNALHYSLSFITVFKEKKKAFGYCAVLAMADFTSPLPPLQKMSNHVRHCGGWFYITPTPCLLIALSTRTVLFRAVIAIPLFFRVLHHCASKLFTCFWRKSANSQRKA